VSGTFFRSILLYVDGVADTLIAGDNGNLNENHLGNNEDDRIGYWQDRNTPGDRNAVGFIDDFRVYDHVLSPSEVAALVPEPSTFALAASGLLGLALHARRRRK